MKVVQLNTLGSSLSTGRTTREMHEYFIENGIESYIICPAPIDSNDVFCFSSRTEMRFDTALTMLTGLEAHHSRIQTLRLIRYLDKIKPDIVQLRILHSNYINLPLLFRYLSQNDVPTVITLHDFWFLTGKCCFFTNLMCDKWKTGCYSCCMPNNKRPLFFERSQKMWLDKKKAIESVPRLAFVGVSEWAANQAYESNIAQKKKIRFIYNWIDLKVFRPKDSSTLKSEMNIIDKHVILGVSAQWVLNDRKGLNTYLSLAEVLPADYVIVLVGEMRYSGVLPNNIISVGATTDKELMSRFYSMADVYLNLSTEETFGKVTAEALSCGTPIVAIDATVNSELIPDGGGLVIPNTDLDIVMRAIKTVIEKMSNHPNDKCRSFAEKNFNMTQNIEEYISLYKELINRN